MKRCGQKDGTLRKSSHQILASHEVEETLNLEAAIALLVDLLVRFLQGKPSQNRFHHKLPFSASVSVHYATEERTQTPEHVQRFPMVPCPAMQANSSQPSGPSKMEKHCELHMDSKQHPGEVLDSTEKLVKR